MTLNGLKICLILKTALCKVTIEQKNKWYLTKVDIQNLENLHNLHNDLLLLPKRIKIEKLKQLQLIFVIKVKMKFT